MNLASFCNDRCIAISVMISFSVDWQSRKLDLLILSIRSKRELTNATLLIGPTGHFQNCLQLPAVQITVHAVPTSIE